VWFKKQKITTDSSSPAFVKGDMTPNQLDFIHPRTGRHLLDALYEIFVKPQLRGVSNPNNPSIYIRHQVGQEIAGGYTIEQVFEDSPTGFYAEGRVSLNPAYPPVLVIRGYGSWYPFERVLEDTPDVFIADLERQLKAAETQGVIDWLQHYTKSGNKPDLIGESLGGKVAQQIAAKYPNDIRSTVTFNALGVSRQVKETSKAENVFHYFTLGERYAFWANRGDYIPGKFFQISKKGKSCQYKLEEALIRMAKLPRWVAAPKLRKRRIFLGILAQLILLKRHNDLILNRRSAVVVQIDRNQLREA
jgi:pimeloyl-ACP methyl ester carboxylesterase